VLSVVKSLGLFQWFKQERDHAEGDFFTTDNTDSTDEGADRGTGIFLLLKTTENENGEYPTRRGKE